MPCFLYTSKIKNVKKKFKKKHKNVTMNRCVGARVLIWTVPIFRLTGSSIIRIYILCPNNGECDACNICRCTNGSYVVFHVQFYTRPTADSRNIFALVRITFGRYELQTVYLKIKIKIVHNLYYQIRLLLVQ